MSLPLHQIFSDFGMDIVPPLLAVEIINAEKKRFTRRTRRFHEGHEGSNPTQAKEACVGHPRFQKRERSPELGVPPFARRGLALRVGHPRKRRLSGAPGSG